MQCVRWQNITVAPSILSVYLKRVNEPYATHLE